ncbi:hypothetical protein F5Y18DRAFT_434877 [Xylariaceae sp. FL1019]|nr:hypothetical protein F5Y18DRAFT_434877 [Xylariaceae sp. FL1019]
MDTPLPTAPASPAANHSPLDLSGSSGTSRASTRDTSPSSTPFRSRKSSPLLDSKSELCLGPIPTDTVSNSWPGDMERNPFQSVNDRRNKLVNERGVSLDAVQDPQPLQTSPQLGRPIPQSLGSLRSLTSSNWRAHQTEETAFPHSRNVPLYNPFDPSGKSHSPHVTLHPLVYPNIQIDQQQYHPSTAVASYSNHKPLSESQLDTNYAYCYDRGDGQYTRLIPADMLPVMRDIPATQVSCVGMIVIPQPRGFPPNGRSSNTQPVTLISSSASLASPADPIQSRIDNIVATTPQTPAPSSSAGGATSGSGSGSFPNQRRPKIYCDKWVHEGVCAFTQQGCKYKHEMPFDKKTQNQLGLFHGFPAWWKKHQADLARQRDTPLDSGNSPSGTMGGSSITKKDPALTSERYFDPVGSTMGQAGDSGGGFTAPSDTGGHTMWQQSDSFGGGHQASGSVTPIGRGGGMRSSLGMFSCFSLLTRRKNCKLRSNMFASIIVNLTDSSLCLAPYGSPFGPIAPPARNTVAMSSSATSTSSSPYDSPQRARREGQSGGSGTKAPSVPTDNPYASLATLRERRERENWKYDIMKDNTEHVDL